MKDFFKFTLCYSDRHRVIGHCFIHYRSRNACRNHFVIGYEKLW